jgi:glycosyltransferase involved in cell wall biosynthesis
MTISVAYYTDSGSFGGAEKAMLGLIANMDRERWQPSLYYHPSQGADELARRAAEMDISLFPIPSMPLGMQGARRIPDFVRQLRACRPQVFHAHLTWPLACKWGLFSAVWAGVEAVVATDHLFLDISYTHVARLQQALLATLIGRHIAVSEAISTRLQQTFFIPAGKIKVIYNTVLESANTGVLPVELDPASRPVVLAASRLDPQKGLDTLLEAAVLTPDVNFYIAGDGDLREQLETQARLLGLHERVRFLGWRNDLKSWLATCDLFVLPSRYEGLPLTLLEALDTGKAVVASDIPGVNEVIEHGKTGWLVPVDDPQALAAGIRKLLAEPDLASGLGCAGQESVAQRFSMDMMKSQVTAVYEQLLAKRHITAG